MGKKNPGSKTVDPGYPFFIHRKRIICASLKGHAAVHAGFALLVQAGLLTLGSSYRLRLPGLPASGILQLSSPITAAGPSPNCTGFPFQLKMSA